MEHKQRLRMRSDITFEAQLPREPVSVYVCRAHSLNVFCRPEENEKKHNSDEAKPIERSGQKAAKTFLFGPRIFTQSSTTGVWSIVDLIL
jgi:hypothetical protein